MACKLFLNKAKGRKREKGEVEGMREEIKEESEKGRVMGGGKGEGRRKEGRLGGRISPQIDTRRNMGSTVSNTRAEKKLHCLFSHPFFCCCDMCKSLSA